MKSEGVISLMYHDISRKDTNSLNSASNDLETKYVLSFEKFEHQIKELSLLTNPKHIVNDALDFSENEKDNPVLITFDDGKSSNIDAAAILESYGFRGYFFIIASRVGKMGYMSKEEILSLWQRGHIIGTHSLTHPPKISELEYKDILHEWQESTHILSSIIGDKIRAAAVPGGFCSKYVIQAAEECGISILFNSEPVTLIDRYKNISILGRYNINSSDKDNSVLNLVRSKGFEKQKRFLSWNLKKLIKKVLGKYFLPLKHLIMPR